MLHLEWGHDEDKKNTIFQCNVKQSKFTSLPMLEDICYFLKRRSVFGLHLRVMWNKIYVSLIRKKYIFKARLDCSVC